MTKSRFTRIVFTALALLLSQAAQAYDYIEHAYISDRACLITQKTLAPQIATAAPAVKARYLALGLLCPLNWKKPYCSAEQKSVQSAFMFKRGIEDRYSITLGDYSGLVDHLSSYGQLKNIPFAERPGVINYTFEWMAEEVDSASGRIRSVGEEGCENDNQPDYSQFDHDISLFRQGALKMKPADLTRFHAPAPKGPGDSPAYFAIVNPRYLDLQLTNQDHFGERSYRTWLGFHDAAMRISESRCEKLVSAEMLDYFDIDPEDEVDPSKKLCRLLEKKWEQRLLTWRGHAPRELVNGVDALLAEYSKPEQKRSEEARQILRMITPAVLGAVYETAGLHFLQDNHSGGHIRTDRTFRGLAAVRHQHDFDNRHGLPVKFHTAGGAVQFTAFGDGHFLAPGKIKKASKELCSRLGTEPLTAEELTDCMLSRQRSLILMSNAASLGDFAGGGLMYEPGACNGVAEDSGTAVPQLKPLLCSYLPLSAAFTPGEVEPAKKEALARDALPVPFTSMSYESLMLSTSYDGSGNLTQIGGRVEFLSELDSSGYWLHSYDFAALMTLGKEENQQFIFEFAYLMHWRFATRFLVFMGPFTYLGFENLTRDVTFFYGFFLKAGISILPEGWTKLPLQLNIAYRPPWRFVDTDRGFYGQKIEAHWIEISIGLAFM